MKLFVAFIALSLTVLISTEANTQEVAAVEPSNEYLPPVTESVESAKLTEDGYRYKTIRKLKYRSRHRRDVSQEYLPPVKEPNQDYLPPTTDKAETKVDENGYRYKTVRKQKYRSRHRRNVNEIEKPSNDYLPPVEVELAPDLKTILADDGYRYQTVRRLKYRRHRRDAEDAAVDAASNDIAAAPINEYLPPAEEIVKAPADSVEVKSAELADDGYHYKTVRKIRYRARH